MTGISQEPRKAPEGRHESPGQAGHKSGEHSQGSRGHQSKGEVGRKGDQQSPGGKGQQQQMPPRARQAE